MVTASDASPKDVEFPGKDREEAFQFYFRQHWIRLSKPLLRLLAWMLVFGIFLWAAQPAAMEDDLTRRFIVLILIGIMLIAHFEFLARFYNYFLYVVIVTDKKVHRIKRRLMTTDDHQTIDLWVVQDIDKSKHGVIQNLLGFGTINLEAQYTSLKIHFTPHIDEKHQAFMRLREIARMKMLPQQMETLQNGTPRNPPPSAPHHP